LLGASYFFYGWWDWRFLGLLVISTLVDFNVARYMPGAASRKGRKLLLLISIVVNLGILGFFKYYNFFAANLTELLSSLGWTLHPFTLNVILPLGISFYTLQTLGYTIDVYRGKMKPCVSLIDFSLFVSFFPQLVAGPIERASHLIPQLQKGRRVDYEMLRRGCFLILFGLFQKMVVADNLAVVVDRVFANPRAFSSYELVVGVYAFAFQIYCDFAGYSNIAIGTASLLGIDIMTNFNVPYSAGRIGEFWRRWHISLSTWLRDYLYITLGGNRTGNLFFNLMITMLIVGLWHGASWNMLIWGGYPWAIPYN
jgi:D-alanyl-lipoteichoic acid acyltransferase DltB (MBOAT superfamily)